MNSSAILDQLAELLTSGLSASDIKAATVTADISARITKERIDRSLTQKQFAEIMGVSQAMISKWESGDYNFTIDAISRIFEKLDLDYHFEIYPKNGKISSITNITLDSALYTQSHDEYEELFCCA